LFVMYVVQWTPCECSSDSISESSDKIIGYWCP
jgi:hypothetical protein